MEQKSNRRIWGIGEDPGRACGKEREKKKEKESHQSGHSRVEEMGKEKMMEQ